VEAVTAIGAETVVYLYGFVRTSVERAALACGDAGVFLIDEGDIACAASIVAAGDYHVPPDAATAAQQLEWVAPRAWRHHDVLRHLHVAGAVVPLKFGTLCPDVQQVREMLRRLRDPIMALLAEVQGKDEWTLNIRADVEVLAAALRHTQPALVALAEEANRLPEGHAYFARKKAQRATSDAVAARLAEVERSVWERLACAAIGVATVGQQRSSATENAIAPMSVLVSRVRQTELHELLAELEAAHTDAHVTFELVGPWPPYSFAAGLELTVQRD
jgi:hypothetical protein